MPTSSSYILTPVLSFVSWLGPRSVLDVGCGYGQWGILLRQHLDYPWTIESTHPRWGRRIDAIEVWEGYRTSLWNFAYDHVVVGDALSVVRELPSGEYDLALCVELLEHLPPPRGRLLLGELRRVAAHLLVTTPDLPMAQGEIAGNPHERHRSFWSWTALKREGATARLPASGATVAVFSSRPHELRSWLRSRRLRVLGPLLPPRLRSLGQQCLAAVGLHPGAPAADRETGELSRP